MVRIIDGNQKELLSKFLNGPTFEFSVPFFDNLGDRYTVLASADHFTQAGFTPVNVSLAAPQPAVLMLLPKDGTFPVRRCHVGAHALLEVIANAITGGLTDPKVVYALRWIAGRHAGVPEFNPPYTIA